MHVFLTGEMQVGKSTVIAEFFEHSSKTVDGFMTYWECSDAGFDKLYLAPYTPHQSASPHKRLLGNRNEVKTDFIPVDNIIEVFDAYGKSLLDNSGKCDYIVMDELGFLESNAEAFIASIMERVDGDAPIIGVLRNCEVSFIQEIRAHENVVLKDVTIENRGEILRWLLKEDF